MSKTISIHSFRGGTGKSNSSANISYSLASQGFRVGVIDTDIQSPGIHVLFGLDEPQGYTLNDYLWGNTTISNVAVDISSNVGIPEGQLFLIPSSMKMGEITKILKQGYDVGLLNRGFKELRETLKLDYLIIDTHPGLNEETLLSIAISDALIIVMRPDKQDFQGTSVTVEVARRLKTKRIFLLVNKALSYHDPEQIKNKAESVYNCPVAAVLPLSQKMAELASGGLFVRRKPDEPWSVGIKKVTKLLTEI